MDLVTLIATCALSVEPKSLPSALDSAVTRALTLEQSGGEPWSFPMKGEGFARVLATIQDALREARAVHPNHQEIHVGLAGLPTDPESATALMFAPCPNIALATLEITQLAERCKATARPDPIYCAIAAYHGSWERSDEWFANDVRAAVQKGNAPNFEMPDGADDIAADATPGDRELGLTGSLSIPDERRRAWSSALFPAKPTMADGRQTDIQDRDHRAAQSHSIGVSTDVTLTNKTQSHELFVPGSGEPQR
jgi:hypothetical protein